MKVIKVHVDSIKANCCLEVKSHKSVTPFRKIKEAEWTAPIDGFLISHSILVKSNETFLVNFFDVVLSRPHDLYISDLAIIL